MTFTQSCFLKVDFKEGKLTNLTNLTNSEICFRKTNVSLHDIRFQKELLHALSLLLKKQNSVVNFPLQDTLSERELKAPAKRRWFI